MAELTYREAVAAAIAQEMRRDENVVFEDVEIKRMASEFEKVKSVVRELNLDESVKDQFDTYTVIWHGS